VGLRDLINTSRLAQVQDGDWQTSLKALNKAYDKFVKTHGPINAFTVHTRTTLDEDDNPVEIATRRFKNNRLLREDYDSPMVTRWSGSTTKARSRKARSCSAGRSASR
jgi:N12 class adenine-specific DNA methylase